ncbi:ribbon-helix-helix domain-containing protein [Parasphingorhabdus halotolerans]|uniref:CopG family transcriptional regulator n=1 Tax=Parasphingorhabdus halotolerans TaxID=2725558 RepID=A0A6H2DII7_9SPHN|nr:ribbon-helix-helix domain-containing protein [Parasphingorhabdus halotolerans]QJB68482.1 CopG family transcriptional regulator [Parasphingorhabdus halotolerans]
MARILADLPEEDVKWLDALAAEQGKSRAQLLREAVAEYRAEVSKDWIEAGFGIWAKHGIGMNADEYDRKRRAEWTRPWDDDYDEVRAESPDCFTEEDDKERAHYLALTKKKISESKKTKL